MIHVADDQAADKDRSRARAHTRESDGAAVDNSQLRSFVERLTRLHGERKDLADDIADILKEAASNGFDKAALKEVVRISMEDPAKREKRVQVDDALSVYCAALGIAQ